MDPLANQIRHEIDTRGPIPFARFMELALYCPELGYYDRFPHNIGQRGDYYTSVSTGSLFGELLAFQFNRWTAPCGDAPAQIVEAGAHDGRLARDILSWLRHTRPQAFGATEYWIQEPSPRRRAWQEATLRDFTPQVRWFDSWTTAPDNGFSGVVFANELLDAFPVRRFGWDAARQCWFEWCVGLKGDCFTWVRSDPAPKRNGLGPPEANQGLPLPEAFPAGEFAALPDGFTIDLCPDAALWWAAAARALRQGWLLTIDYGLGAGQWLAPHRAQGTLRAYRQHHLSADVLADPGGQDLTAHVDFEALRQAGEAAGLQTVGRFPQARFLTRIAEAAWQPDAQFGEWTASRTRQFLTLTHPDHLGERFQVLVQSRSG